MPLELQISPPPPIQSGALALAEQSRATQEVQASLVIAKKFPRDEVNAIERIKNSCRRPTLAGQAVYQFARGGQTIEGPSIRLAEAVAQQWGNITFGFRVTSTYRDDKGVMVSEVEAYAWDLETNTKRPAQFSVRHWRDTKQGGYELKEERDVYELIANMAQRRVRACIMAVIPGDVFEDAVEVCNETLKADADNSPEAQAKIVAAFAKYGIGKDQLEAKIQRKLDAIQPAQVVNLRKILSSIKDGVATPGDFFEVSKKEGVNVPVIEVDPAKPKKVKQSPAAVEFWKAMGDLDDSRINEWLKDHDKTPETATKEDIDEIVAYCF
jgi:hypothetical protein